MPFSNVVSSPHQKSCRISCKNTRLSRCRAPGILGQLTLTHRFPDVEKTLTKLKAADQLDLYMFSNGSHITLQNARSTHDILSTIFPKDKIVTVDDVKSYKPSRASYTHMLKTAGKLDCPREVILISSNPFDICGARNMGMRAVWINRSPTEAWFDQLGDGPTWTCKAFSELANFVPD